MNIEYQKQLVTVVGTAFLVVLMEILLFVGFILPTAEAGLRNTLSRDNEDGRLYDNAHLGMGTARAVLCTMRTGEIADIKTHNSQLLFKAFLIALLPLLIVIVMFMSSSRLRQTSLKYVYADIAVGVLLLVIFQGLFYIIGTKWRYTAMDVVTQDIVRQYREGAGEGENVCLDPNIQTLFGIEGKDTCAP